jgi:hypothetical protein
MAHYLELSNTTGKWNTGQTPQHLLSAAAEIAFLPHIQRFVTVWRAADLYKHVSLKTVLNLRRCFVQNDHRRLCNAGLSATASGDVTLDLEHKSLRADCEQEIVVSNLRCKSAHLRKHRTCA